MLYLRFFPRLRQDQCRLPDLRSLSLLAVSFSVLLEVLSPVLCILRLVGKRAIMVKLMTYPISRDFFPFWLLLLLAAGGCASSISSSLLLDEIGNGQQRTVIVDVRTTGEFRRGHLPGAVNISILSLPFRLGEISVESRDEPVVVYCAHGPRAGLAGFVLKLAGFREVYHLQYDMAGWQADGLPLEK